MPRVYSTDADRLLSRIRAVSSGCWEWTGSLTRHGYGQLGLRYQGRQRTLGAHRLSYEVFVAPIPHGLCVCHHCDNRRCINPEHLFVGTSEDNQDDRKRKGRRIGRFTDAERAQPR